MIDTIAPRPQWVNIYEQQRRANRTWTYWYLCLLGLTGLFSFFMMMTGPGPILIGGIIFLATVGLICYRPRFGIYMILFFSLIGDKTLLRWYPFSKNLSSAESLLYIHDAFIFSPLEFYLVLTLLAWLGRGLIYRSLDLFRGALFWPSIIISAFLLGGFIYGVGTGGNTNIALWEVRPIFYLPIMLILVSNLIQTREHVTQLVWTAMGAIFVEGLIGTFHYVFKLRMSLAGVQTITEHSAAIHINTFFVLLLTSWLYKASPSKRFGLLLMVPPVALTYIATQRRSAFLSLGIALLLILILIYIEKRELFWSIAPIIVVGGLCYLAVFWNSNSAIGLPAQAVKSIIAPDPNSKDASSNLYRELENTNISFTIHNAPLTGVGFGQKFHIIVPMPDISFFVWWEYIVHNSVLWVWLKTGVLGFIAMIFFMGYSIMTGVRSMRTVVGNDLKAVAVAATLYLVMHYSYAYVDMSWDGQSMLYVGAMMGLVSRLEQVSALPVAVRPKRWPWQPEPSTTPGLDREQREGFAHA